MIKVKTLDFLKDLAKNNDREWFALNKNRHDDARENVLGFATEIIEGLAEIDKSIPNDLTAKDCVMRIYRDIRFSLNKTPYKNNFGAGFSPDGKKFDGPGYYLHISPQECFVAGGCWMPEALQLKLIRQEIDYNASEFKESLKSLHKSNSKAQLDSDHKLKTAPKGYPADHPEIEFLRLKSFTVTIPVKPTELTKPDALTKVLSGFKSIYPFILFLRNAVS